MRYLFLSVLLLLSACSITQTVEPAEIDPAAELCVIKNSEVRDGFIQEFHSVLTEKGIKFKMVAESSIPQDCEWTATYTARWTWDLALYLSFVEIKVFHNGSLDGIATYDSTRGGANMSKFIDAEPKIRELVEQLMQRKSAALYRLWLT